MEGEIESRLLKKKNEITSCQNRAVSIDHHEAEMLNIEHFSLHYLL